MLSESVVGVSYWLMMAPSSGDLGTGGRQIEYGGNDLRIERPTASRVRWAKDIPSSCVMREDHTRRKGAGRVHPPVILRGRQPIHAE